MDFKKMKLNDLKKYAEELAIRLNVQYKKSVHGKNKSELFKFIENINTENSDQIINKSNNEKKLELMKKSELIDLIKKNFEYNESFDKKTKKFLIDYINSQKTESNDNINADCEKISPIHFDDYLESPNIDNLKDAISKCLSEEPFDEETYKNIKNSILNL